jgi:hypothetical protein
MIVVAKYDLIERSYTTVVVVIFRKLNLKPCSTIKNWRDFGLFIYCFEKKKKNRSERYDKCFRPASSRLKIKRNIIIKIINTENEKTAGI